MSGKYFYRMLYVIVLQTNEPMGSYYKYVINWGVNSLKIPADRKKWVKSL